MLVKDIVWQQTGMNEVSQYIVSADGRRYGFAIRYTYPGRDIFYGLSYTEALPGMGEPRHMMVRPLDLLDLQCWLLDWSPYTAPDWSPDATFSGTQRGLHE